jgi:crotonobetainyl-CoA:carnitine CoA-transferase CaiB-like acyl-CoA transferase
VQNIAEVARDPQVNERGMFVDIEHPTLGPVRFAGNPIKMSRTPTVAGSSPPDLGQHSNEVLEQQLGMTADQISELIAAGVVS